MASSKHFVQSVPNLSDLKAGNYVTGTLLWGDGSPKRCKVVSTEAHISRDAIVVVYEGGREVMLIQSILKVENSD